MIKQVLFIQGGGNNGYNADKALVVSLQKALGKEYDVSYPEIKPDEALPDFGWLKQIDKLISYIKGDIILVGHSFGASMLLKYLSENLVRKKIDAIFLIATPFWNGDEDWQKGLKLKDNFAETLPEIPMFFYHCKDDEEAPFSHLDCYKQKLPRATFREIQTGGHQLNNDLTLVAKDIQSLNKNLFNRKHANVSTLIINTE